MKKERKKFWRKKTRGLILDTVLKKIGGKIFEHKV